ncbi:MAG: toll/interleukin-1 receptor domain-containing protein [Kangiellaceae bacterium]|nr:toll/interleukin-1 receptor domain-containing protein [Kangiellaceae bacterium]
MNAIEKIKLLEKIGIELQAQMTFSEIDVYFGAHGINFKEVQPSANSKRIYAKEVLANEPEEVILKLAEELGIPHNHAPVTKKEATFWKAGYFKLFISHLASFKVQTSNLQSVLKKYGISAFVAHEDIEPSREWQNEIEAGLQTMDALAAILMDGFKESNWCDQEVGVAVGRDVLIIPVRRGLDPYGFIGKYQGIQAQNKTVGEVADAIFTTIVRSPKTRMKMLRAVSSSISQSTDIMEAIEKIRILSSIENIPTDILESLKQQISENYVLIESQELLNAVNSLLIKYGLTKVVIGTSKSEEDWDDIPF